MNSIISDTHTKEVSSPVTEKYSFVSTNLPKNTFKVIRFVGEEAVSSIYRFEIDLLCKSRLSEEEEILQSPVRFTIQGEGESSVVYKGILQEFYQFHRIGEYVYYRAVLVPRLWWLSQFFSNQIFMHMTAKEFLGEILRQGGLLDVDFEFRLQEELPKKEYVCQYNESHLNFFHRWLEEEGLYYYFDQRGEKEKLIITDTFMAQERLDPGGKLVYVRPSALEHFHLKELIFKMSCRRRRVPHGVVVRNYHYESSSKIIQHMEKAAEDGIGQIYTYGEHIRNHKEATRTSKIRKEAIKCRETLFSGESTVPYLQAGYTFELRGRDEDDFDGEYFLLKVSHRGSQASYLASALSVDLREGEKESYYLNSFEAIPANIQYRPEKKTEKPRCYGFISAHIDAEIGQYAEPDEQGRYRVRMPFDVSSPAPGKGSVPLRLMRPYAGPSEGMHFPLRKGTEVMIAFVDGDPDRPFIAGTVCNSDTPDIVTSKNNFMGGIKTARGNQLSFSDLESQKRVSISTGDDKAAVICRSDKVDLPSLDADFSLHWPDFDLSFSWPSFDISIPWPPPPIPMPDIDFPDIVFPEITFDPITIPPLRFYHFIEWLNDYILIEVRFPEIYFDPIRIPPVRFPEIDFPDIPYPYTHIPPPKVKLKELWTYPKPSYFPFPHYRAGEVIVHFPDRLDIEVVSLPFPHFEPPKIVEPFSVPAPSVDWWPHITSKADGLYVEFPEVVFPPYRLFPDIKLPSIHFDPFTIRINDRDEEIQIPDISFGEIKGIVINIPPVRIPPVKIPYPDLDFDFHWPDFSLSDIELNFSLDMGEVDVDEVINKAWDVSLCSDNTIGQITYHNFSISPFIDLICSPELLKIVKKIYTRKIRNILHGQTLNGEDNKEEMSLVEELMLNAFPFLFITLFSSFSKKALKRELKGGEESRAPKAMLERLAMIPEEIKKESLLQKAKREAWMKAKATAKKKAMAYARSKVTGKERPKRAPVTSSAYGITILSSVPKGMKGDGIIGKVKKIAQSQMSKRDPRNINTIKLQNSKPHILLAARNGAVDIIGDKGVNVWSSDVIDISTQSMKIDSVEKIHTEARDTIDFESSNKLGNKKSILSLTDNFITIAVSHNKQFKSSILMYDKESGAGVEVSSKDKIKLEADKNKIELNKSGDKIIISAEKVLQQSSEDKIEIKCGSSSIVLKKDGTIELKGSKIVLEGKSSISVKSSGSVSVQGQSTTIKNNTKLS